MLLQFKHCCSFCSNRFSQVPLFLSSPDIHCPSLIQRLLQSNTLRKSSLLPVTSLVNSYCKSNDCQNNAAVDQVVNELKNILGRNCNSQDDDLVKIGNIHIIRYFSKDNSVHSAFSYNMLWLSDVNYYLVESLLLKKLNA